MLKRLTVLGLVIALVVTAGLFILSGCDKAVPEETAEAAESEEAAPEAETAEAEEETAAVQEEETAIEVTDGEGNPVVLEGPAQTVVVMAPSVLEIVDGLGAMDMVVEIDNFTVMMQEPLAEGFEGVGDYQSLNVERIAELDPDLMIAISGGPDEDYNKVSELGIPIYRVISISGMDGVYEEIENVSKMLGLDDEGTAMIDDLKDQVEEITGQVEGLTEDEKPTVFYEISTEPIMSAGTDTFISALIEMAGGVNILSLDDMTGWPQYSAETLIERNPDIIIAPLFAVQDTTVITGDERFASISAIVNNDVYLVPDNPVSRPSQNIIEGLQILAEIIHPEIFGEYEGMK